jgi:hypothetical protein
MEDTYRNDSIWCEALQNKQDCQAHVLASPVIPACSESFFIASANQTGLNEGFLSL